MKRGVLLYLLLMFFNAYSQVDEDDALLSEEIKKVYKEENRDFNKACVFFFKKEIDSSFFYSSKVYNSENISADILPYLHYIYGVSALQKGFNTIASKRLKSISPDFTFKYLVDYNLGSISLENQQFKEAISYYTSVLNSNKVKSDHKLKIVYHNIGICYLHLKKYAESESFLLKELSIAEKTKDSLSIIYSKLDLGNLFYQQYKDDIAIPYFKEAYEDAKQYSNIRAKQNTAQNMAVVEKNRKRYKESVDYYREYIRWKDSLWNRDRISELLEKDKQIAVANKEKEISVQKEITKKQKERVQFFIICFGIVLILLIILIYLYRIKTKQHKVINSQNQQLAVLNRTKNYLFSVISHDLRSPVNALVKQQRKLTDEIVKKDLVQAEQTSRSSGTVVEGLHHLLNNILHWSLEQNDQLLFNKREHRLSPIIEQVILDFEGLAITKNIELSTNIEQDIAVCVDKESLKIILRNIVDNGIKYTESGGQITILARSVHDRACSVEIRDTGKGISPKQIDEINGLKELSIDKIDRSAGVGLGMLLCVTLVKKNGGIFNVESTLGVGTIVRMEFPIND